MKVQFIKVVSIVVIAFMVDTILVVGFGAIAALVVVVHRLMMDVMFWFVVIACSAEALVGFGWTHSTGTSFTMLLDQFFFHVMIVVLAEGKETSTRSSFSTILF